MAIKLFEKHQMECNIKHKNIYIYTEAISGEMHCKFHLVPIVR